MGKINIKKTTNPDTLIFFIAFACQKVLELSNYEVIECADCFNQEKGFKITAILPQHYALLWRHVRKYRHKRRISQGTNLT